MPPTSLNASQRAQIAHLASSPAGLAVIASQGQYALPRHVRLLNQKLLDLAARRITRLLVTAPPRHGKSALLSHYFPAWYLGTHPTHRVMLTSYEADFAASWGRKARDVLAEWGPHLYGVHVREDSSAAYRWDLHARPGGMTTAGAGGALTGRGSDLLLIDDPVKNAEEALSPVQRDHLWDWYQSTAYTRLEPGAAIALTMTRWHENDLAGRILAQAAAAGETWDVVTLPALADAPDDPLGRALGEPLWPERFDVPALERIRGTLQDGFWWHALYQQRPTPAAGTTFQAPWFQLRYPSLESLPPLRTIVQSVDSAFTTGVASDWSVIATWGTDGRRCYLLGLWRGRVEYPGLIRAIQDTYAQWHAVPPGVSAVLIERKASGISALQTLRVETHLPVVGVEPEGSKVWRAEQVSPLIQGERVLLPESAPWLADWLDEHLRFPRGAHDDCVDTTTQALHYLRRVMDGATAYLVAGQTSDPPWGRPQPDAAAPDASPESLVHQQTLARMLTQLHGPMPWDSL